MTFSEQLFEIAKANTDVARTAYEAGYQSGYTEGWKAAVVEAIKILDAAKKPQAAVTL